MDTKDTAEKTASSEAPAELAPKPRPGQPEPEKPVPSVPLSGLQDDSLKGLEAASSELSVGSSEGKAKEKEAVDIGAEEEDPGGERDPSNELPFDDKPSESARSASEHSAASSPYATTHPATHQAASSPTTTPPTAECLGLTGMPYPIYGVDPVATAPPMATAVSEPEASSSTYTGIHEPIPRRYTEDYHRPPTGVGPTFIPGYAAPQSAYAMPAPDFTSPSGLRGPESCGGRNTGSGRSSNRSRTRSEIKEALRGATGELDADLTEENQGQTKAPDTT